jgi:hypothetical protein
LLGDSWKNVVRCWKENLAVSEADLSLLDFADTAEEACRIIMKKAASVKA